MVRVLAEAMSRPEGRRAWHAGFRRFVVAAAAASLMLLAVGTGMARTAARWLVSRFEAGRSSAPIAQSPLPAAAATTAAVECVASSPSASMEPSPLLLPGRSLERPAVPTAAAPPAPSAANVRTDLASQNQLFTRAMNARRSGDAAEALRALDEFIGAYPQSPLVQDAYVARFRTLAETRDRAAAVRAARAYLAVFPRGFAREEAAGLKAK
jgi:hypothetical protein